MDHQNEIIRERISSCLEEVSCRSGLIVSDWMRMTLTTFNASVFCLKELTRGLHKQYICFSVVNIVLAFITIAANTPIPLASQGNLDSSTFSSLASKFRSKRSLCWHRRNRSRYLLDLHGARMVADFSRLLIAHLIGSTVLFPVSLCKITAISVDRLLALLLGLTINYNIKVCP